MTIDGPVLERLAEAAPGVFAAVLADVRGLGHDDLLAVIDAAGDWAWDSPVSAARVAAGCRALAADAGWADAVARAGYVEARGALAAGDVERAGELLADARATFQAIGDTTRTRQLSLGMAHVEAVAGRFERARAELVGVIESGPGGPFADAAPIEDRTIAAKARQNLAALEVLAGRYDAALPLLREAETTYFDLGMRREWIDVVNNRALALLGLGRSADAAHAIDIALPQLAGDEVRTARAELLDTAGRASLLAGRIADAIDRFTEALALMREAEAGERAAEIELALADAWSTLRLHDDAATGYRAVLDWAAGHGAAVLRSWAELGLGISLIGLDRRGEGEQVLQSAFGRLVDEGQTSGAISAGLALVGVLDDAGERAAVLEQALALGDAVQRPADQVMLELAAYDAGRGAAHLEAAQRLADALAVPRLRYEVDLRRARALRSAGETDRALAMLRRATALIESTRGELVSERHRRAYLTDRLDAHVALVSNLIDLGGPDHLREAFDVAERARSRSLLDAMSGMAGSRRASALDETTAEQLERFSRDLEALYNGLLGDEELRGMPAAVGDLAAIAAVGSSDQVVAGQAEVVDLGSLQAALADADATMISYHTVEERLVAFIVSRDRLDVRVLPCHRRAVVAEVRRLDAQLSRFRAGHEFAERWSAQLLGAVGAALDALSELVLEPLGDLLDDVSRLVVVPSREVMAIPFAALRLGRANVVDAFELVLAPSASAWARCRTSQPAEGRPLLVAVADERAPRVDSEVDGVAALLPGSRVMRGPQATRCDVRDAMSVVPPPAVAHLACHGVFHHGHAMFSALRLADGWVTAHELACASLEGSLVALSACESGRFTIHTGDEIVGLPRALLVAGARDVVASNWLAHDEATAHLMRVFYERLTAGDEPASALRHAQRSVRGVFPHPFHWAAFSVFGAGWRSVTDAVITPFSPALAGESTTLEFLS